MKGSVALLLSGLIAAALAWVFWRFTGEYGFTILVVIAIAALASRSARLRKNDTPKR